MNISYRSEQPTYRRDSGEITYLPLMGQSIAILGSARVLSDLLDKRSAVTSDKLQSVLIPLYARPHSSTCTHNAYEVPRAGQTSNFSLQPYGPWWRRHRRAFWQFFFPAASERYRSIQRNSTQVFLRKLLDEPDNLVEHIR